MNIVFVARNVGYLSRYEGTLRLLLDRGHKLVLVHQEDLPAASKAAAFQRRLVTDYPDVRIESAREREDDLWKDVAKGVRQLQDYVRYFRPQLASAHAQRERVAREVSTPIRLGAKVVAGLGAPGRVAVDACLRGAEAAIPVSPTICQYLRDRQAALLLVTPLVESGSDQVDYLRAAQALGIHTGFCVASWDNLTHKGSMRVLPDRVFVWNDAQKEEAVTLHDVPPDRVVVTGAQLFDWWFDRKPSRSYEAFCRRAGLDPTKPYVLYLGSSQFISPNDAILVERWVRWTRNAADPALATAGVLVRPHPKNAHQFLGMDLSIFGNVALWHSSEEDDPDLQDDYFDSVFYSAVVAGVNTSAMVEAAIVGRPVCTLVLPELAHSQVNCPHFQHLTHVTGGLLHVSRTVEEHLAHLSSGIASRGQVDRKSIRFAEAFLRPHGLTRPATPILAEAIEATGALAAPRPAQPTLWFLLARGLPAAGAWLFRHPEPRVLWVYPVRLALWLAILWLRVQLAFQAAAGPWRSWFQQRWDRVRKRARKALRGWLHVRRDLSVFQDRAHRSVRRTYRRTRGLTVRVVTILWRRSLRLAMASVRRLLHALRGVAPGVAGPPKEPAPRSAPVVGDPAAQPSQLSINKPGGNE